MEGWSVDIWDVAIILAAGYVAWMTLVRLMARRHAQLVESIRSQMPQRAAKAPPAEAPEQKAGS